MLHKILSMQINIKVTVIRRIHEKSAYHRSYEIHVLTSYFLKLQFMRIKMYIILADLGITYNCRRLKYSSVHNQQ